MAIFNFWKKNKKTIEIVKENKPYSLTTKIDADQLVSKEHHIISRLERKNFINIELHLDLEGKIQLYTELTGIVINEENLKRFGKSLHEIEARIDLEIKELLQKRELTIILK